MLLHDQFLISVESVYDEFKNEAGISGLNPVHYFEGERDRSERKLRHGQIYSVPEVFSEKNHMPIDPGYPNPRMYISHDSIQKQVNLGFKWDESYYHPGAKEQMEFITIADYGEMIDAKAGDKCYIHPMVTEPEKLFAIKDGVRLYLAEVNEIVCVVRNGVIIPQGGYILLDPIEMDDQVNGLVVDASKKDEPLKGIVRHTRDGSGVDVGDVVLFQEDSNWDFVIEGHRYYAMLEEDIFVKCIQ